MNEYLPMLILGGFLGLVTLIAVVAYIVYKKTQGKEYERNMTDMAIIRRLLRYVKGYWGYLALALVIMLVSVGHDVISPLLVGHIEETLAGDFELSYLFSVVGVYVGVLLVSLLCTYLQALILQHVGQKILSALRLDVYDRVQQLSHNQLSHIPVGKLVTRVVHDPAGISYLFTNITVTLVKNIMVLIAVVVAMLIIVTVPWGSYSPIGRFTCTMPTIVSTSAAITVTIREISPISLTVFLCSVKKASTFAHQALIGSIIFSFIFSFLRCFNIEMYFLGCGYARILRRI